MTNEHLYTELKYQATSIQMECEQKLNWWYFSIEYIQEKLDRLNSIFKEIKATEK